MNATTQSAVVPTVPGTPFEGGFYAGRFRIGAEVYALIVSPNIQGSGAHPDGLPWINGYVDVPGARSFSDGLANTRAMAEAGSDLARQFLALEISGFSDWYLPSRDELELLYRHLKPTTETNYTYRSGENPSAAPAATYAYTDDDPVQTPAQAFQEAGEHAFEARWYWSSTQASVDYAWHQYFDDGLQYYHGKTAKGRARAVRRFRIE